MKRLVILSMSLLMGLSFTNCKKGENDPTLSLKSRNARITGEWELSNLSGTLSQMYENGDGTIETYVQTIAYNNGMITATDNEGNIEVLSYTLDLNIGEDQNFTVSSRYAFGEDFEETSVTDQWFWLDGTKKKTQIALPGFSDVTSFGSDDALSIDRLAKDELHLIINSKNESDGSFFGLENEEVSLVLEFEKQ